MTAHDTEGERQRLAEVYAGETDEELTSLAQEGGSLTDIARTALRHELNRRGIRLPRSRIITAAARI
jgi:hypothetical protein